MRAGLTFSITFHAAVFTLAMLGLPHIQRKMDVEEKPIVVDLVDIGEITNVPSAPQPQQPKKEEPKPPEPKPEPPKAEIPPPPPAPTPPKVEAPPPPKPEPPPAPKPEPAPEPIVAPPPEPKPEPKPKPEEPKPVEKPKPQPPRQLTEATPKRKPKQDDLAMLEQAVRDIAPKKQPPAPKSDSQQKPSDQSFEQQMAKALNQTNKPFDPSLKLSMTEEDALRQQLARCWNLPAGAVDAQNLIITVKVQMNQDRTVRSAEIVEKDRMAADPFFRAAAESARRALFTCQPLRLPADKFAQWETMEIRFNPRDMF